MKYLILCIGLLAALPSWAAEGYFGFGIAVEAGGFFLNPKVESATVRQLDPASEAADKGVQNGDKIVQVGDCRIPGCRGKLARKMVTVDAGVMRAFTFERADGTSYEAELTAVVWPARDDGK